MGITDVQHQLLALFAGTVADTVDLKRLAEAVGDALDHVGDEGTGQAVHAAVELAVVVTGHMDHARVNLDLDAGDQGALQSPLGALDSDVIVFINLDFHARGNGDRSSANSRHISYPPYHTNARTSPPT